MIDVLIERGVFLTSLEGLLGEALGGSGRLVFLGGEAGVGKTTLAAALAGTAAAQVVRRGCCDKITTAEALGPLAGALPEITGCWTARQAGAGFGCSGTCATCCRSGRLCSC